MIVDLAEIKTYLGIDLADTTSDGFLVQQSMLISETIEAYCARKFNEAIYTETFYASDQRSKSEIQLFAWPVKSITSINYDNVAQLVSGYRLNKASGRLYFRDGFFLGPEVTEIVYVAGYSQADIPAPVKSVALTLIGERYNKRKSGVDLNFGQDVQRIGIAGVISVDFDYSLQNNERKSAFGSILGSQVNILDFYRSERAVIPSGKVSYVDVT